MMYCTQGPSRNGSDEVGAVAIHEIVREVAGAKIEVDGCSTCQELLVWKPGLCPGLVKKR